MITTQETKPEQNGTAPPEPRITTTDLFARIGQLTMENEALRAALAQAQEAA